MLSFPTVDTTKLAGQLSVVQELPEVSRLVFQEVKADHHHHHQPDNIVNILETMKEEDPLDYSTAVVAESPLNLVNHPSGGGSKGVKRVVSSVSPSSGLQVESKRLKNVLVVQGEDGQVHHLPASTIHDYSQLTAIRTISSGADMDMASYLEPPQQSTSPPTTTVAGATGKQRTSEAGGGKSGGRAAKLNYPTKTVAGTVIPSSKTCNWVFENGQVCGKTFSKSYNLVVHMRMHEDIRPFACTLCDQTFRQKAHLQRHETTHGIQSKNFYRNPPAAGGAGGRRRGKRVSPKLNKGLQDRLANAHQAFKKKLATAADSEGEEMHEEEEEEDVYVPNGTSRLPVVARKYSEGEQPDRGGIMGGDEAASEIDKAGGLEPMHAGSLGQQQLDHHVQPQHQTHSALYNSKGTLQVGGGGDSEMLATTATALNLVQTPRSDDDDTSTVQDILHTVNSVPTLEQQKLETSFHAAVSAVAPTTSTSATAASLRTAAPRSQLLNHRQVDTASIASLTLSNNNLPAGVCTTLSAHLPGTTTTNAQTNILYTTLAGSTSNSKLLSLMENNQNKNSFVIENLDEHSPEIQAELLNALLADQTYHQAVGAGEEEADDEEEEVMCQEEVYRLNTLPTDWWVLRRRRNEFIFDITYYSGEGLAFKTRADIQNFLQHNLIPRETKAAGLRQPPIPIEEIPIIDDDMVTVTSSGGNFPPTPPQQAGSGPTLDANSIAQALIANLKPEPLESLQESLAERRSLQEAAAHTLAAS